MVAIAERACGAVALVMVALLASCSEDNYVEIAAADRSQKQVSELTASDPKPPEPRDGLYVNRALRCAECHEPIHSEWRGSAHARASSSPLYRAMLDQAPDRATCGDCHAPLAAALSPSDALAREGVTCDVCHTVTSVEVSGERGHFTMNLRDNTKYASLCDADDHYFHRMGCSPLHSKAELCGGCHFLEWKAPNGARLPVITEFREWQQGPYAARGKQCQRCHMPERSGEVATGAGERDERSHHGYLGEAGRLRQKALELSATASPKRSRVALQLTLKNRRAGHRVPSGFPGREVVLRTRALAEDGRVIASDERTYARRLVDADGREAPYFLATREASDNRLRPTEERVETLELPSAGVHELVIDLLWRELSPELARRVGYDSPREELLSRARIEPSIGKGAAGALSSVVRGRPPSEGGNGSP